jgi:hypothetical protein
MCAGMVSVRRVSTVPRLSGHGAVLARNSVVVRTPVIAERFPRSCCKEEVHGQQQGRETGKERACYGFDQVRGLRSILGG